MLVVDFPVRRALLLLAVVPVAMGALLVRVAWLQTEGRPPVLEKAERQQSTTVTLPARRGCIYDSTGQLLAGTMQVDGLFIDSQLMVDTYGDAGASRMEADLNRLGEVIGMDGFTLLQRIGESYPDRFVEITRDELNPNTVKAVNELKLPGVGFTPHNVRVYPMGSLASHILGAVGADGKGIEGVELVANNALTGKDGSQKSTRDARHRNIGTASEDYSPPQHGKHVVLSIDANIQTIVEGELVRAVNEFKASGGECVVINPKNGEIVALANYPTFSPQFVKEAPDANRTNRALVIPYEPGSTIKPFIVAGALDRGLVKLDEIFTLNGPKWQTPYGRTITDVHGYDKLAGWDVLVKSSNIGMSQIAERIGNETLRSSIAAFGFGSRAGSDMPGDAASGGVLNDLKKWTRASPESVAQGYEMMVTPIQMARAMAAIANDGKLYEPHVIRGTLADDGRTVIPLSGKQEVPVMQQAVSPSAARQIRRVLADVPVRGTAKKARSSIYNLFGKTGTAHRAVNGQYDTTHYTASFVGGAPFEDPKLVIAFVIHDPNKEIAHYGGLVSAPSASRVLEQSLTYMGVAPSPDLPLPPDAIAGKLYEFDAKEYKRDSDVTSAR